MEPMETWKSTLGSIVRFLLGGVTAYLVQKGVVTAAQGEFLMIEAIAAVIAVVTLAWAHVKNTAQSKLVLAALNAPPSTPLAAVRAEAEQS